MSKVIVCILMFLLMIFPLLLIFAWIEKRNQIKSNKKLDELFEKCKIKKIDTMRVQFRYDLIGEWKSFEGSVSTMRNESWRFNEDGSGKITYRSVMSGEEIDDFKWRRKGEFNIEILYFNEVSIEPQWIDVKYDFCEVQTDCGGVISLIEIDGDGNSKKGFGLCEMPLSSASAYALSRQ